MTQPAPARAPGRGRFSCRGLFLENFRRKAGVLSLPVVLAALLPMAVLPPHAMALPQGGQVVAGQVTSVFNGTQLTLDQASRAAIMNWESFGIAPNEFVRILQQGPDAALLARVTGGDPSQLLGRLKADGKLFLINPRGILVGPGAVIDTAAFLASTLDVADADFLKGGPLTFQGDSAAGVVNLGRIIAREGNVLLLAHTVKNDGEIAAPRGTAGLAAGTEVYLASPDAPAFVVKANLTSTPETTGVDNSGLITAAQAQLEAAGGSLFDLAVNHSGMIHATGVEHLPDGRVLLTASGGNVLVSGAVAARNDGGAGGEILIGGDYQGKNAAVANAARTQVTATATLEADAGSSTGDGGRIIVWADEATRYAGRLSARAGVSGGDGGFAEVSGKRTLGFLGTADLSAPAGRSGSLLLDPDNITIVAGAGPVPDGLADRSWLAAEDPGDQTVGADIITDLLATGSVYMRAGESLTVDAPIIVTGSTDPDASLTLQAPEITINASISLAAVPSSDLDLFYAGGGSGTTLTTAAGATISASRIRVSQFPIVALNGAVETGELQYFRLGDPATSFQATNPGNAIAKLFINSDPADPDPVHFTGNLAVHSGTAVVAAVMVGAANNVTLSSDGNLTLVDDELDEAVITASGVTRLASTGGVLINQAGDDLLAGSGRRLLYTSDTDGAFTLGGLAGYTQFDGVGYPEDPQAVVTLVLYNAAGSGPTLTLTITANDFIRLYGESNPTFTASYSGGTAADLITLPTFTIGDGPAVNVGTYTIVPSGAVSATHSIQYVNGTLTINPVTLTYVANPVSRLYGDANPAFSGTVTGFVNGDTLETATTGTLAFTSSATAASHAGSHAILGGGLAANHGNYVFADAVANHSALTIDKAPLTVTFADATRVYGAPDPDFTATFTGLRNGDTADSLGDFRAGTSAQPGSPVGTYLIGGTATLDNYVLTVIPGTLTITPAPLTLTVGSGSFTYGTDVPPALTYTLSGLVGGDTPSVLTGVQFDTAAFAALSPGEHEVRPSSPGSAQNYTITTVVPGLFTVARKPVVIAANDQTTLAGVVPTLGGGAGVTPLPGGPQFTVGASVWRQTPAPGGGFELTRYTLTPQTPPGDYVLVPEIVPAEGTTLAEIERYYTFTPINGRLRVDPVPADTVVLTQVFDPNATVEIIVKFDGELDLEKDYEEKIKSLNFSTQTPQVTIHQMGDPLSVAQWSRVVLDSGEAVMQGLLAKIGTRDTGRKDANGNPILSPHYDNSKYSVEEIALLADIWSGKLTLDQLAQRIATDELVRSLVMPLIVEDLTAAVTSGRPLTQAQSILAGRVAENINIQRATLKAKLAELHQEFIEDKIAAGTNNPFSLKTMPDIALSAQQAATEQLIAAAISGIVGGAVGSTVAGVTAIPSVASAIFPFAAAGKGAAAAGGATTAAAGAAAGVVAVAVSAIVIGVVAGVMVVQEQANINAYDAAVQRANTPVSSALNGLDLTGDDIVKSEFYAAFMATFLESGFQ